jgi:trimethylamine:corrinoid methyltransferase-like protein
MSFDGTGVPGLEDVRRCSLGRPFALVSTGLPPVTASAVAASMTTERRFRLALEITSAGGVGGTSPVSSTSAVTQSASSFIAVTGSRE